MKIEKKAIILSIFILNLILLYGIFLKNNFIDINFREGKEKEDIRSLLSSSDPYAYEWGVLWEDGGQWSGRAQGIALDSIENIYIAGYTRETYTSDFDMFIVKYNSSGDYQWNVTWGSIDNDYANDIVIDNFDNFYLAGRTTNTTGGDYDLMLVKLNNLGEYQWNVTWGREYHEYFGAMAVDPSGNIFLTGMLSNSPSEYDICIVKFNSLGEHQWNVTWGGNLNDESFDIVLDSSGNIYVAGGIYDDMTSETDMLLVKFNQFGVYQWNYTLDRTDEDYATGIALDASENIYLGGYIEKSVGNVDIVLTYLDSSGVFQWNHTFGNAGYEIPFAIALDSSGNINVAGEIDGNFFFIVCDSLGFPQWNHTWGSGGIDRYYALKLDSSENIYLTGIYNQEHSCLVKLNAVPKITIISPTQSEYYGSNSPNFNISILETDIDNRWYTLNGGENITFSGFEGKVNQTEWNQTNDGPVTLTFYVNDSLGLEGASEISFFKDTESPISSILFIPHSGINVVNDSSKFILTADDGLGSGVFEIKYKIKYGTIYDSGWIDYTVPFDLSSFESGDYLISYYSIDQMGNIEDVNTITVELIKLPSESPAIPGYLNLLLISIIGAVSLILIRNRKN